MNRCSCILASFSLLVLPVVCVSHQERLILSMEEGACLPRVEADDVDRVLMLRVGPEYTECHTTKESMQKILKAVFSKTDPPKLEGVYTSLFSRSSHPLSMVM